MRRSPRRPPRKRRRRRSRRRCRPSRRRRCRVCANPDNLPFSNQEQQGFENKIAQLIGAELGLPVSYLWHAQRRGYLRRTLNAGRCDLVMGAPVGLRSLVTTKPYYRSTYVFVTRKDRKLGIRSFDDPALKPLKIGLHVVGDDGENPPPVYSLARRGLANNVVGYKLWDVDGIKNPQGRIIDAVAKGEIDVAVVWGPFAGYFAKQQRVPLDDRAGADRHCRVAARIFHGAWRADRGRRP